MQAGTETLLTYDVKLEFKDKPINLKFYTDSEKTEELIVENEKYLALNGFMSLEDNKKREIPIYWEWKLTTGDTEKEIDENDVKDTAFIGKTMQMQIAVTGTQVQDYPQYTVGFNANGGEVTQESKTVTYANNYGEMPTPTKQGYTFDGWFTKMTGGEKVTDSTKVSTSSNHTLYARWTFNIYDLDPIINVNSLSSKGENYWGTLYPVKLYSGNVSGGFNAKYNDNDGNFEFNENGALVLDEDNTIAILDIGESYNVGDVYTVSTTVNGDVMQYGNAHSKVILAISGQDSRYLTWIGYYKGFLHVYSYTNTFYNNVTNERIETGFASIDVNKYTNQTINIQVTSVRGGVSKVYINGEFAVQFNSGNTKLSYNYLTIGDLRVGRNLKFNGKIYDFAIFDRELTAEQVKSNYENSKKYIIE